MTGCALAMGEDSPVAPAGVEAAEEAVAAEVEDGVFPTIVNIAFYPWCH